MDSTRARLVAYNALLLENRARMRHELARLQESLLGLTAQLRALPHRVAEAAQDASNHRRP